MTRFASGVILALLFMAHAEAAPVDLSTPSSSLGASNSYGFLTLWREYGDVDFGKDLKLPLRAQFSSQRQTDSVCLGKGWWLPLTEASAYLKREKMLTATLICGKTMYLRKDATQINTFYTLDKEWKGVINGKNINISREDGWNLHYENGRIKALKTDTGRTLTWVYSDAMVVEIKEDGSPSTPFKLDLTSNGSPKGIYVNNKMHGFTLDKRPKVQSVTGKNLVTSFDAALSSWKWPDGTEETYQFEVTEEVQPNLKVTDPEAVQTTYVWDAASGHIVSDGQWTYSIGKVTSEFELPELRRVNKEGKDEFVKVDNRMGIFEKESLTKGRLVTEIHKTSGPLYGKVKKVVRIEHGQEIPVLQYSYDEKGILLRKSDDQGLVTFYSYNAEGKLSGEKTALTKDPAVIKRIKLEEEELVALVNKAYDRKTKNNALFLLGSFYGKNMEKKKALEKAALIKDPVWAFNLKLEIIMNDRNQTAELKANEVQSLLGEYPDRKLIIDSVLAGFKEEMRLTTKY